MDDKDLRLQQIMSEYIDGTHWQNRNYTDMTTIELAELMKEVIDYGIKKGYLEEVEVHGDSGCTFRVK